MIPLETIPELEEVIERSMQKPVVVFKHSSFCGISAMARYRLKKLSEENDPEIFELVVQRSRELSNEVASRFNIKHESPQIIVFYRREPVFHTSHSRISAEEIRKVVAGLN